MFEQRHLTAVCAGPRGEDAPVEEPVVFSPSQQIKLDEIVRRSMGRAAKEVRDERDALRAQLDKIMASGSRDESSVTGDQTAEERREIAEIRSQTVEELKSAKLETLNIRRQTAINKALSHVGFFDPEEITELHAKHIDFDETDKKFVVKRADGHGIRLNNQAEAMTLEQYFADLAVQKPHLVRADVRGGTGSSDARNQSRGGPALEDLFGSKSKGRLANDLGRDNPQEYARLRRQAVERGLLSA